MGLFSKKPSKNKVYTLKEAMDFISKNPTYSAVETTGGYNVIADEIVKNHINKYKQQNSFKQEMSGNGAYKNIKVLDCNSYQSNNGSRQVGLYR